MADRSLQAECLQIAGASMRPAHAHHAGALVQILESDGAALQVTVQSQEPPV